MLEAKAFLLSPAELGVLISLKHTKEKPQTFFKICGLAGETEKGTVMLDNTLFLPDYSVVLTCPVFRCPKKH